jgi:hypothetical protein
MDHLKSIFFYHLHVNKMKLQSLTPADSLTPPPASAVGRCKMKPQHSASKFGGNIKGQAFMF